MRIMHDDAKKESIMYKSIVYVRRRKKNYVVCLITTIRSVAVNYLLTISIDGDIKLSFMCENYLKFQIVEWVDENCKFKIDCNQWDRIVDNVLWEPLRFNDSISNSKFEIAFSNV